MRLNLLIISSALMFASCSAGETMSTTSAEVVEEKIVEENPYSLDDIPDAQSTPAKNETEIFTGTYGHYGDLIIPAF